MAALHFSKAAGAPGVTEPGWLTNVWNQALAKEASRIYGHLPAPVRHYAGLSEAETTRLLASDANYQEFIREKLEKRWFAALVAQDGPAPYHIEARFTTWRELMEFLAEKRALVDVWAYGEGGERGARRIPAPELALLKQQAHEQPTFITVTYREGANGKPLTFKLELAFEAAEAILAAEQAYERHRALQLEAHEILGTRNSSGVIDALVQWTALQNQVRKHGFSVSEMPALPTDPKDLFVACEFEVDDQNNFSRAVRLYRDSEVQSRVVGDVQILVVRKAGEKSGHEVTGFGRTGDLGQLRPLPNPILGQDVVELRVKDPTQPDPQKWRVLEFGEPQVLKQSALAHFAQLNAYLERKRKARLMTQANLALVAEPIIAGLNIGGGIAGLGFPAGESARLLYNLITWRLISQVPTTKEMRELFAVMAARDRNLEIRLRPERFLTKEDMKTLREVGSKLSDQEIQTYLERMSDEDVRAMLRLARQGMFDARITTFLNILASTFKVGGLSDQPGWIRDVFNNVRFSVNGDINLSTLLLIALGREDLTALSGVSLESLAHGQGPAEAWLQYLVVSVDVRAVVNTIVRLAKPTLAKKELEKPFPYSPRMSELAAYEIRIFGFPLLMFYKRGLIKDDREAYEHDFAYGLYGVRLAEHFRTREEMEAEIRAGRMFPLGLVKVPSAKGGWKETELVVYGHQVPTGKFRGKTTLVIYGLKAYTEYSELIGRELIRFKEFEAGLRAGAVIEQRLWDEADSQSPSVAYEPSIHAGSNAVQTIFSPLLSNLMEFRRHLLRQSWGLPVDEAGFSQVKERLAGLGVVPAGPDPLVEIDAHNSGFIYRRLIGGLPQTIRVTSIPSLSEVERELGKAQEGKLIEEMRREAAAIKSAGVVLLNEAVSVGGHLEIGPLLRGPDDQVFGAGVSSGTKPVEEIFRFINRLPVTDRARLRFNHFAATVVPLERDATNKLFLTIEFPLGGLTNEWSNPLTGEQETLVYEGGLWTQTITSRRIVDVEYGADKTELGSRTYLNRGTRQNPIRGPLLEETRTLDFWHRDLSQPDLDPYQPTISKLRVNYVTGQIARETYGLFSLPVEVVDDQYVTRNRYNPFGIFESAEVFDNGRDNADFLRPTETKILAAVVGDPRFRLACQLANHATLRDLSEAEFRTVVEREDLAKALTHSETFDNANFGRKVAESYVDPFDGQGSFSVTVTWEYADDFQAGVIPVRSLTEGMPSGVRLSEVTTTSYDPVSRQLSGSETTYTGKAQTNTWDYRWNSPIEIETPQRRINEEFNRDETASRSTTLLKSTGEVLSQSSAQFDTSTKTWHVTRQVWYRPQVPERMETNIYSAFGKLIRTRLGNSLEVRPSYTPDGMEQSRGAFQTNAASGRFDILCRQEDDYRWLNGARDAHVRVYADGAICDEFRASADAEGRTVEEGIRSWPKLELRTVRTYDGDSERVVRAEVLQNGEVRSTHETLGVLALPGGNWLLEVKVSPFWGLIATNTYLLGEPFGRLVESQFENGERNQMTTWFDGTSIARISELVDRHGRIKERSVKRVNGGVENGLPFDLITRYKVSPWGAAIPVEEQAMVRGTDVPLFCDLLEERLHFDLSKRYQSPEYAADPRGQFGLRVDFQGTVRSNVTALFANQIRLSEPSADDTNKAPDSIMELSSVDLRGFFSYPCFRRTYDRAGNLLEELRGKIKSLGAQAVAMDILLAQVGQAAYSGRTSYQYQQGWMRRQRDKTGQTAIVFKPDQGTNAGDWRVNDTGWRETPTTVRTYSSLPASAEGITPGFFLSRRFDSPRLLATNRHLPGVENMWEAWSSTDLGPEGEKLFDSESIFDARGELSSEVVHKKDSRGRPATKVVYQLPEPSVGAWRQLSPQETFQDSRYKLSGFGDFSMCDFVAFFLEPTSLPAISVQFRDEFNRVVVVASRGWPRKGSELSFWPLARSQVLWLPNESLPRRGAAVVASRTVIEGGHLFVVSVDELVQAGLAVSRLASADLILPKPAPGLIRASPLYRLEPREPVLAPEADLNYAYDSQAHSSNLELFQRRKAHLRSAEKRMGQGWNSVVAYEGLTVASLAPHPQPPYYPILALTDNSDPDSLQPLYTLAAEDGRFLEYYRTVREGDSRVYTIVHGFDTPKMEVFRAGVLDDEISAGILAFGHGYYVTLPLAKASGTLGNALARLHNRCVGSAFALGRQSLLGSFPGVGREAKATPLVWQQEPAQDQARHIEHLPTLAEAILPARQVPWSEAGPTTPGGSPPFNARDAKRALLRLQHPFLASTNGLIPTSPASVAERYVDTVREAGIIGLAVNLRELATAKQLLTFYWNQSQGGTKKLHTSYDAWTGASLAKQPNYARPSEAPETVGAQLAIAQAAFRFGIAAGETNVLNFGSNLLYLVLNDFRPTSRDAPWPRGIAEKTFKSAPQRRGPTLWPEENVFSMASNARAFLLLRRLREQADQYPFGTEWKQTVTEAEREEAAWLTNQVARYVGPTGVVPKGLFELQDVLSGTTALAVERWTTTDGWLSVIEAANALGINQGLLRGWLHNLARAHGVVVKGVWGLDWSIPLRRPDAISTELTAKFRRLSALLGDQDAEAFARRNLDQLRKGERWPMLVTSTGTEAPLQTGEGSVVYPVIPQDEPRRPTEGALEWPETLGVYAEEQADATWTSNLRHGGPMELSSRPASDITQFFWTAAGFYLAIVAVALFWWGLSYARRRRGVSARTASHSGLLVPEPVMQRAEERWAKRVLGMRSAPAAEHSRYSNGAVEQNFQMQLRAIYKLTLEWRRVVQGWAEDDPRLADDDSDEWLNGLDEFAALVGIYTRWVIKAGRKDGLRREDVLEENEDSNHIWARLVMYFSESHLRLLKLMTDFKANPAAAAVFGLNDQIELVLRTLGARARPTAFDARSVFNTPASAEALDLLLLQMPAMNLTRVVDELERRLEIPRAHLVSFIKGLKSFKEREQLFPLHPYVLEAAKVLPHFLLMGLVGLIWYNTDAGGLEIYPYLRDSFLDMVLGWQHSLIWALPLLVGFSLSTIAHFLTVYRYRWGGRAPTGAHMVLDAEVTTLIGRVAEIATPALRTSRWWNPLIYQRAGWILRAVGLGLLAVALLRLTPPSFAIFMFVKMMLGMLLLLESASLLVPILLSGFSRRLEDHVTSHPGSWRFLRLLNQLNILPTRPASLTWLSIKYHFQPSVPSGGAVAMLQTVGTYLVFGAAFFFVGSYLFMQALEVWFREAYQSGWDLGLVLGMLIFWNTMYLLRFGLFVLLAALASALVLYPFKTFWFLVASGCLGLQLANGTFSIYLDQHFLAAAALALVGLLSMAFESQLVAWVGNRRWRRGTQSVEPQPGAPEGRGMSSARTLGVVYMSGDDLSFFKLTPDLLIARLKLLRTQLGSGGLQLLSRLQSVSDDQTLYQRFKVLHALEAKHDVTLWHPAQLVVAGHPPSLREELGLNLILDDTSQRQPLLATWHLRRWVVTMMSTAGDSQDTAINLADIALALARENLAPSTVFYLIQNKYDDNDNNRPSQLPYDKGELGQRNKLARLLMELAPGSRAYSVNDWTPFGFKGGGLVGMDLVYEESLRLTNMLILDRNANAHDLDAVVSDLKSALADPGVVNVIPGRGTTNTLTPIGQGSQLIEEGHRALVRGVMVLGGNGAETLGTGWGNIQAVYYGRVQRALCDNNVSKMPLTTPSQRHATFGDRCEGLIGFGPHAIGISEDIWGVSQAAHNAMALGYPVRFKRSRAFWHKIRETWSHAEWFSAFPRWSGGYVQMMLDPLMQQINDGGPWAVFAKEIRANGGRFFLSAPFALLNILLMPLAVIWDVSPFVQILILLWNLGLVMNQVLTALGLLACLESTGFNCVTAIAGALGAAVWAGSISAWTRFGVPLAVLGFVAGGFAMGLGRWLYYRGRDVMLFGPQLVIHALGQVVRQSLEFVLSGVSANDAKAVNIAFRAWAGPREDRPFEVYQHFVNLRTVVWGVGLLALLLNLFALSHLDFLNVLLLLPTLMFSVSTLLGPFLAQPKPGRHLGLLVCVPKLLGWIASCGFYMLVARLVAFGGWFERLGVCLCLLCFGWVLASGMKYLGYSLRLRTLISHLVRKLVQGGLAADEAQKLARVIVRNLGSDVEKIKAVLQQTTLAQDLQTSVAKMVQERLMPLLKRPTAELERPHTRNRRFISELSRSFVLGLFTFIWFFVVPIPGLLVFTAPGGNRISISLAGMLTLTAAVLGGVLAAGCLSLLLERWEKYRLRDGGLVAAIEAQYRAFQSAATAGRLSPWQTSLVQALFTDVQVYFDQRSYAYAKRSLDRIERTLEEA